MEMDVNRLQTRNAAELMTISARCRANSHGNSNKNHTGGNLSASEPPSGCCGILSRLCCVALRGRGKPTHVASSECNNTLLLQQQQPQLQPPAYMELAKWQQQQPAMLQRKTPTVTLSATSRRRRTPQEIYFESRGKSCKKLLKFNGNSNKILLYPEEGWARTASSSYWTITPCWWQPNRCRIVECAGTQRQATKAKMLPLEQQGSLLIAGHFRRANSSAANKGELGGAKDALSAANYNDEFKLYLTSNISMEDYNMGYCLTGFVERRCQPSNTFQMTHFAVIKRQWPPSNLSDSNA